MATTERPTVAPTASPCLRQAPGLRQRWPLPYGALARARRDPLDFYCELHRQFGDVVRWQVGSFVLHVLYHPDHVRHVLQDRVKNYPRSLLYRLVSLVTGNGLVTSEGEFWLRQRRMAQPGFHRIRLAGYAKMMTDATAVMLQEWSQVSEGAPVDVSAQMMRLTLRIVGQTLLSEDLSGESDPVGQAVTVAMDYINYRINHLFAAPLRIPTPRNLRFRRAVARVDALVFDLIRNRRADSDPPDDLLNLLLTAHDEQGAAMTDRQLRDELVTIIGAGHETTAVALAWTWYLLAQHPAIEQRLRVEIHDVLDMRTPTIDDLPRLDYTRRVIEESMRLYPPVWGMTRDAADDDEIGGYRIPKGSMVFLCQYVTHRHPEFWVHPDEFDPERFASERVAGLPKYAYFPFAGGPHQCIGNEFAMMEAMLIVAMVVQRYRLELAPSRPVTPDPIFTLRPKPSIVLALRNAEPRGFNLRWNQSCS